ncbi:MAG: S8 family serine peptidase [Mucilaginibacter polytrichastri]|nr:S8 family serine peptidase [Mucilaginibacter polytrichastri]
MSAKHLPVSLIALIGLFCACQKNPTENISPATMMTDEVEGQYIIILKDDEAARTFDAGPKLSYDGRQMAVRQRMQKVFERHRVASGRVYQTYSTTFTGFALKMDAKEVNEWKNDAAVMAIEPDRKISLPAPPKKTIAATTPPSTQIVPWGVRMVGGPGNGVGKTVWVVDSGVEFTHPDLDIHYGKSRSFLPFSTSASDWNGHGTHVAGIIAAKNNTIGVVGVAAGAKIVSCRVLDTAGDGLFSYSLAAFDYIAATAKAGDVVNYSVTPKSVYKSPALDSSVKTLADKGIFVVVAAGNVSDNTLNYSPARVRLPNVYVVSAIDSNRIFANFSNWGASVTHAEPGVDIYSTYKKTTLYATMSGTSMAAPHLSGILLLGPVRSKQTALFDWDDQPDPIGIR